MIDIADTEVSSKKHHKKSSYQKKVENSNNLSDEDKWELLNGEIKTNFNTFFNNLRFHQFPMRLEDLKRIYMHSINASISLLTNKPENQPLGNSNSNRSMRKSNNLNPSYTMLIEKVLKIGKLPSFSELTKSGFNDYETFIETLSRDSLTYNFNEAYLEYLLNSKNLEFNAMYFSTAFIKLSNTLNMKHSTTDTYIKNLVNSLSSYISKYVTLESKTFSVDEKNFLINLGGGDLYLLLNPEIDIENFDIQDFIKTQNHANFDNGNLLRMACSNGFKKMDKYNYFHQKEAQSQEAKVNKNSHVTAILNNEIIENALNIILSDSVHTYKELFPTDNTNVVLQRKFLELLAQTGLDLYNDLNIIPTSTSPDITTNPTSYKKSGESDKVLDER